MGDDDFDGDMHAEGLIVGGGDDVGCKLMDGTDDGATTNGIENCTISDPLNSPPSAIKTPFDDVTL